MKAPGFSKRQIPKFRPTMARDRDEKKETGPEEAAFENGSMSASEFRARKFPLSASQYGRRGKGPQ